MLLPVLTGASEVLSGVGGLFGAAGGGGMFGSGPEVSRAESSGYFAPGPFNYNSPGSTTWLSIAGVVLLFVLLRGK